MAAKSSVSASAPPEEAGRQPRPAAARVNRDTLRRQRLTMLALCSLAVAAAFFGIFLSGDLDDRPAVAGGQLALPGASIAAGDLWQATAERDLQQLAAQSRDMEDALSRLAEDMSGMEARFSDALDGIQSAQAAAMAEEFERELQALAQAPQPAPAPAAGENEARTAAPAPPPLAAIRFVRTADAPDAAGEDAIDGLQSAAADMASVASGDPGGQEALDHESYLPGGTFMPAVILGGIDAPTATTARDNPHPVLLRVAEHARLPNLARKDMRECFVLAAGYGDLSSERALLRTERMSCRRGDGTFFDAPVRGFVVGEDGRAGVRGRLVTKQGQVLAESFAAGIGAGFGDVIRDSYTSQLRTSQRPIVATGDNARIEPTRLAARDLAVAGFGSGASSALSRLSEYYIALAERLHPVIEVSAGRRVDIVLQAGVDLRSEPQPGK